MGAIAPTLFEAVIIPHRSLSRRGMWWLTGALCGASAVISTGLWLLGAWPVVGFNGAELALAFGLLRWNVRASRASELLLLSADGLRVIRTDMRGRRAEQHIPPAWLSVDLSEQSGRTSRLWLVSRSTRVEVASSLGETEKQDLAEALKRALNELRHPVFDNPQLRT